MEALLLAVKSTNDFEAEMARRFGGTNSEDSETEVAGQLCMSAERRPVLVLSLKSMGRVQHISHNLWSFPPSHAVSVSILQLVP